MDLRHYARLGTERPNTATRGLDKLSVPKLVGLMNREDRRAVEAVGRVAPAIARGVAAVVASLAAGGKLFLAGAGTSGRLCVLEAAECPPTFNTSPSLVQAFMAGGKSSVFRSREGAEDRGDEVRVQVRRKVRRGDVVVGVAASGVTAYALAAMDEGRRRGAKTILVTCNPPRARVPADIVIAPRTGPEVLTGSTRLKAGTATKLVLNSLTTLAMARLGKVYGHHMVDLQPRSKKLMARSLRLVSLLGRCREKEAAVWLKKAGGRAKTAILMARRQLTRAEAESSLRRAGGFLGKALGE